MTDFRPEPNWGTRGRWLSPSRRALGSVCSRISSSPPSHWFSLPGHIYRPPDRVDADTKTQGQGLDDGLSRIRHTNCECELAQLVEEERGDDGRNRKTTTAKQRRSTENDNGDGRKEQRIALERRGFAGDPGHEHAGHAVEKLGVYVGQQLMKLHPKSHRAGRRR